MIDNNNLFTINPYSLEEKDKITIFNKIIKNLTKHHYKNSKQYKKLLKYLKVNIKLIKNLENVPFLPVKLFKDFDLFSVKKSDIIKVLHSSGTSGSQPSKIYLDKTNAIAQSKALNIIVQTVLGKNRTPMLIIDKNPKNIDRKILNARMAAINGFSIFGKNHTYLLDEKENIDYENLNIFLNKHSNKKFFIFGFTSIIYEYLIKKLSTKNFKFNFRNGILLHGGGWKKMENIKISNLLFKKQLKDKIGIEEIYNYYGLVEQTGSIFIECKCGYFISSIFSDILIRSKDDFKVLKNGSRGFIQLFSTLPTSYPGHSILTEDVGEIVESHKCKCSKYGKRFIVHGRMKESEARGCSDV